MGNDIERMIPVKVILTKRDTLASYVNHIPKNNSNCNGKQFITNYDEFIVQQQLRVSDHVSKTVLGGACVECGGSDLNHGAIQLSFYQKGKSTLAPHLVCKHFKDKHPETYKAIR